MQQNTRDYLFLRNCQLFLLHSQNQYYKYNGYKGEIIRGVVCSRAERCIAAEERGYRQKDAEINVSYGVQKV